MNQRHIKMMEPKIEWKYEKSSAFHRRKAVIILLRHHQPAKTRVKNPPALLFEVPVRRMIPPELPTSECLEDMDTQLDAPFGPEGVAWRRTCRHQMSQSSTALSNNCRDESTPHKNDGAEN
jgi:hypothetical protein